MGRRGKRKQRCLRPKKSSLISIVSELFLHGIVEHESENRNETRPLCPLLCVLPISQDLNHRSLKFTDWTSKPATLQTKREQAGDISCMLPFNDNKNNNKDAQCVLVNTGSSNLRRYTYWILGRISPLRLSSGRSCEFPSLCDDIQI